MSSKFLSMEEIDRLLGHDLSTRAVTPEEFQLIDRTVIEYQQLGKEINFEQILKEINLEGVKIISEDELKSR